MAESKETEFTKDEVVKHPVKQTHALASTAPRTIEKDDVSNVNLEAIIDCNRYSSKTKLLRVTALVLKFVKHLKREERARMKEPVEINAKELLDAEMLWLKSIQSTAFETEFKLLKSKKEKIQLINPLNFFLDERELIGCQGRLDNSDLPTEVKTPILLPCRHRYTELGIQEAHKNVHHNGIRETLNRIREKYCVLRGRESVKRMVKRCVVSKKMEGKSFSTSPVPALPQSRVSDDPPFANTGLDFAGPLLTSEDGKSEKTCICLFTCASTRAAHLELLKSMSADWS
jgi:hypothetical protein